MTELHLESDFSTKTLDNWRALVKKGLRGAAIETLNRQTEDDIARGPLFRAEDLPKDLASLARTNLPLLETRDWHIAAPVRDPDLSHANRQLLEDLKDGASAIRLENEVKISSRNDLKRLLEGVHTNLVPIQVTPAPNNRGKFEIAKEIDTLKSTVFWAGLDPIGNQDLIKTNLETAPKTWRLMGLSPANFHEQGATDVQELAFLAASFAEAMRVHGPEPVCRHMVVDLSADRDTHLTIAKFRAARRLVRRIANAFGQDGGSIPLCAITSLRMMQREDAWTNLLRIMSAGSGAVCGGADMVTTRPFTDRLGQATPFSHRIARNMQLLMMEESHLGQVADPAHGSYWHETLTENLSQSAWSYFQSIEAAGGMSAYEQSGQLQTDLERSIAERSAKDTPILGVTLHPAKDVKAPEVRS